MQQKKYRLILENGVLENGSEKELAAYSKEIRELAGAPGITCAFVKVMFFGIFQKEAEHIIGVLRGQLPGIEVIGISKTYAANMEGKRHIELSVMLAEKSTITTMYYAGCPDCFFDLGQKFGQRLAAMPNLKAVELYTAGVNTELAHFIEMMSDEIPDIPVFGAIAGMFYRHNGEVLKESIFEMVGRVLSDKFASDEEIEASEGVSRKDLQVVAEAVHRELPEVMGDAYEAGDMHEIFARFMKKLEEKNDFKLEQYVIADKAMHEGFLVVLYCGEELYANAEYVFGWKPLGKEMIITEAFGNNCLSKIDDEPAINIYKRYLGVDPEKTLFFANIFEFPMVIERNGLLMARTPFFYDKRHRLYLTADVHAGERIRLTYGNPQELLQETWAASLDMEKFAPQAIIMSVCINRLLFLREDGSKELDFYERLMPELSVMFGQAEIFRQHGKGGILGSALVAVGLREGEKHAPCRPRKLSYEENPMAVIPLATRLATFLEATTNELEEKNDSLEEMAHALTDKNKELGQLAQKADAANIAKSQFLSSMSHEIRTPINAVLGMDEMILRETNEAFTREYAENIRGAGNSLLSLVNDILDFSKIEAGHMDIIPVEYSLSSVLNDLMNMLKKRAEDKGLRFLIEAEPTLPSVIRGDEVRVKQVLTNILTNAIKYTDKGFVSLRVREYVRKNGESMLHFEIQDTGIGIKEEDIEKLFVAFERLDEKRNRTVEGTGLGMNITQKLLHLMGSELRVESFYGKGSTFFFNLVQPVIDDTPMGNFENAAHHMLHDDYKESFTAPTGRVLVVDDTEMNLTVVKGLLKPTLLIVDTANSGIEALELLKKRDYDIVFLDHRMPGMDGIDTLKSFLATPALRNKRTPMISLTANAVSGAREMYMRAGFTDYLTKPVSSVELEAMLIKYLPEEKIKITRAAVKEPDIELPNWLLGLRDLDVKAGIENCGSATAYLATLKVFFESIPETLKDIQDAFDKNDWENYTIKVHALKSTARIVGATELSERAKRLESAGNSGYIEEIQKDTDAMLGLYESYRQLLALFAHQQEEPDDKPMIGDEELAEVITTVREFVTQFDYDSLGYVFEELDGYCLPEEKKSWMEALRAAVQKPDWDEAMRLLNEENGGI